MGLEDDLVASFEWVDGHADIWPWFSDSRLFAAIVGALSAPFRGARISKVLGIEARGFLLAGAVARELGAGVVPVRKPGAVLAGAQLHVSTSPDYRGRTLDLFLQAGALSGFDCVLLVDDWLETGSQVVAAVGLVQETGAQVKGVSVVVDQSGPAVHRSLLPPLHAIIRAEALGPSN